MGCDGGTIPRRDELVRVKQKPEQKDKDSVRLTKWQHCAISQEPLHRPIVSCELGRLYNKESIIQSLLDDDKSGTGLPSHIRNMKDVKELMLTPNPVENGHTADKGDAYVDRQVAPYICPVVGIEMNGLYKFVFSWKCGCVVSDKAMREVKTKTCHKCQEPVEEEDLVILNPADADLEKMNVQMEARRARMRAEKKAKKSKKLTNGTVPSTSEHQTNNGIPPVKRSKLSTEGTTANKVKGSIAGSSTCTVSKDPKASEVYKSIFTSHQSFKNQPKAHWITHNPFYN